MNRLKSKRPVRRAQNTKIIQEARILLDSASVDTAKLTAVKQRLSASNDELSHIHEYYDQYIPTERIEKECTAIVDYQDETLSMLAKMECSRSQMEREQAGHAQVARCESTAVMAFNPDAPARFKTSR
ncbi:hypothetical protein MRX96_052086 [Rhipicephalus microplus]